MQSDELYQDWITAARRADDLQTDFEVVVRRLGEVTAERDAESVSRQQWADRAHRAETALEVADSCLEQSIRTMERDAATIARVRALSDQWAERASYIPAEEADDGVLSVIVDMNGQLAEALAGPNDGEVTP